ncbi:MULTISPECIES: hypothetical protein [unclassified Crossiella]|uniref:hypothetical protein n=1 Tax=unclassified Crossiella TaxID=2620835 RepID=UPI001FFFE973|nr:MULTISPECIES: hypothetical protein [unclassified Crossiella]MCK2244091.1 hypothetical protein [Crossiella sp. S99.2]MCK2258611.1 hypothetical protein [Crossiella sp. S99.1]
MLPGDHRCGVCEGWLPLDFTEVINAATEDASRPRRVRFSRARVWSSLLARLQTIGIYPVALDGAAVQRMKLTEAQSQGLTCLGCNHPAGIGTAAFLPAGRVLGGAQVFRCVACVEEGKPVRRDRAAVLARTLAGKQTTGVYSVVLDDDSVRDMELTQAQAEGYECLTCRGVCGQSQSAFRPVGRIDNIPGCSQVFRCIACLDGGEW